MICLEIIFTLWSTFNDREQENYSELKANEVYEMTPMNVIKQRCLDVVSHSCIIN